MSELVAAARTYLGTPWKHQGRTRGAIDCLGVVALAERDSGRQVNDRSKYPRTPNPVVMRAGLAEHYGPPVLAASPALADLRVGDKLFIKLPRDKAPRHLAIVTDYPGGHLGMIHAWSGGLCQVVEHVLSDPWRRRIVEVYR